MLLDSDIQNLVQAAMDCVHSGHRFKDKAFIFCKRNGSPGENKQTKNTTQNPWRGNSQTVMDSSDCD